MLTVGLHTGNMLCIVLVVLLQAVAGSLEGDNDLGKKYGFESWMAKTNYNSKTKGTRLLSSEEIFRHETAISLTDQDELSVPRDNFQEARHIIKRQAANIATTESVTNDTEPTESEEGRIEVFHLDWEYVKYPMSFLVFFFGVFCVATGYHQLRWAAEVIPESVILLMVGVLTALILWSANVLYLIEFPPQWFFVALLPPIICDASYDLNTKEFGENMFGILLHAMVGTVLAFIWISPTLWGLSLGGAMGDFSISYVDCLVFGSFIVAVDPVAVLAIFNEVGVNKVLYFLVFGESLLNDGVTVVLFDGMDAIKYNDTVTLKDVGLFFGLFFVAVLGGIAVGIIIGFLSAIITRCTKHSKVHEFASILILAYFSYLVPQMFHWSAILSLVSCALMQSQFAFPNIQRDVLISLRNFTHLMALLAESAVFLYMGVDIFQFNQEWNSGFILWGCFFTVAYRGIEVIILSGFLNIGRKRKIRWNEIFMQWWGGLRGAVAYALVRGLDDDYPRKKLFVTACLFIIMFTVAVMGTMTKVLVKQMKIELGSNEIRMLEEIHTPAEDLIVQAIEVISDSPGTGCFQIRLYKSRELCFGVTMSDPPLILAQTIVDAYFTVKTNEVLAGTKLRLPRGQGQCHDCCPRRCHTLPVCAAAEKEMDHVPLQYWQDAELNIYVDGALRPVSHQRSQSDIFIIERETPALPNIRNGSDSGKASISGTSTNSSSVSTTSAGRKDRNSEDSISLYNTKDMISTAL